MAGDPDLEGQLTGLYEGPPAEHVFQLVMAPVETFRNQIVAPSYYVNDGRQAEADLVNRRAQRFREEGQADRIVFCWEDGFPRVLDGLHTLSAAREAGITEVEAYELLDWRWRRLGGP